MIPWNGMAQSTCVLEDTIKPGIKSNRPCYMWSRGQYLKKLSTLQKLKLEYSSSTIEKCVGSLVSKNLQLNNRMIYFNLFN